MRKVLVTLAVCALVISFTTLPVMADRPFESAQERVARMLGPLGTEWTVGGQINWRTFWVNRDTRIAGPNDLGSDQDLVWDLEYSTTRMHVAFNRKNITGFIESNYDSADSKLKIRQAYGEWNFNYGYMLIGQTMTPTFVGIGPPLGRGFGTPGHYGGMAGSLRQMMLRFRFPFSFGEFQIAGREAKYKASGDTPNTDTGLRLLTEGDIYMPPIETRLAFVFKPVKTRVMLSGAFYKFDEVLDGYDPPGPAPAIATKEYTLSSHYAKIITATKFGPFAINTGLWKARNPRQLGLKGGSSLRLNAQFHSSLDDYADVDAIGYGIRLRYRINKMIDIKLNYTSETAERDDPGNLHQEAKANELTLKIPVKVFKGVIIAPTCGWVTVDTTTNNVKTQTEDTTYFGLTYQILF